MSRILLVHGAFGGAWCWEPGSAWGQPVDLQGPGSDAFAELPRAYVVCTRDRAIPPRLQRLTLDAAGCDPVLELDTDHSPWLSRTAELVAILEELARTL